MIQIKKTILTLVALLAVTTGAWAQTPNVKAFTVPDTWSNDKTLFSAADMPSFTEVSDEVAEGIPAPSSEGTVYLFYGFNGTKAKLVGYVNGERDSQGEDNFYREDLLSMNQSNVKIYYTAADQTVAIDWNATAKTGTFTMPGGNVELEPEYYPQAALTAVPSAINDVPATTDGAIVNAGTVATIDGTANAQGTVMYYVSPSPLDDAALLALAADAWTADVPTAQSFTAAGQAYVYYYVRGNDSDNDDENFSDGDILSANALTVTIAAAPTYAVTFADGVNPEPPAEPEWTASPATDVTKGTAVTVTYSGTKKVIGVKAEKKAAAPAPITVTINQSDWGESGNSFTKDGVTVSATMIIRDGFILFNGGTFSTTLGNFTKIVVTAGDTGFSTGWNDGTWTGTPASTVSFDEIFGGVTTIVCTIVPTN